MVAKGVQVTREHPRSIINDELLWLAKMGDDFKSNEPDYILGSILNDSSCHETKCGLVDGCD